MAQTTLVVLGGAGTVPADPAATGDTVVMRDSSGNILAAQGAFSDVKSTGKLTLKSANKTAGFTPTTAAVVYFCDATGGAFTAALPTAVGANDQVYIFAKIDASANAITISGALLAASLATQGTFKAFQSNGSAWIPIG